MKVFRHIAAALLMVVVVSCGSSKNSDREAFNLILFNENGGVVGSGPEYGLTADGLLLQSTTPEGEVEVLRKLTKAEMKQISGQLQQVREVTSFHQEPGNLNRQIIVQNKSESLSYYWHLPDEQVPLQLRQFYDSLMALVNKP